MTTTTPDTSEVRREATDREMWKNGFAPDHDTPVCAWCGDPSPTQYVYESRYAGQTYTSPAYCGDECHTEAVTG